MHDSPSLQELIIAVKGFLDGLGTEALSDHVRFNARVASNVLATALRDIDQRPAAEHEEMERLTSLLGTPDGDSDLANLNAALVAKLRAGDLDENSAQLFVHLKATAIAQLSVDQPKYSGLQTAKETDT